MQKFSNCIVTPLFFTYLQPAWQWTNSRHGWTNLKTKQSHINSTIFPPHMNSTKLTWVFHAASPICDRKPIKGLSVSVKLISICSMYSTYTQITTAELKAGWTQNFRLHFNNKMPKVTLRNMVPVSFIADIVQLLLLRILIGKYLIKWVIDYLSMWHAII